MRALGSLDAEQSLKVKDGATYYLVLKSTTTTPLTADRNLVWDCGDASRTVKLRGSVDLAANFTTSGAFAVTLVATAPTTVTLPVSGTIVVSGAIVDADIAPGAAIAYSKLNLAASIVNADVNAGAAIAYSKLALTGTIVNADVNAAAAIAYSKLQLALSIVNADVSNTAAIAYVKLNLVGSIQNTDVNAAAAIAYTKLNLAGSIVNADVNAAAAIAYSKLALAGSIVDADVAGAAAITLTKLAALTASRAVVSNASGFLTASVTTDTQIGYLGTTTSDVQTQINGKTTTARQITVTAPLVGGGNFTADRSISIPKATGSTDGYLAAADFSAFSSGVGAVTSLTGDVTGTGPGATATTIANSAVTGPKIAAGAVDLTTKVTGTLPVGSGGTNSNNALANSRIMKSAGGAIVEANAITPNVVLVSDGAGIPTQSAVTTTTLGYLDATSSIQTQLNTKAAKGANSDITSMSGFTGPIVMAEGSPSTGGGYLFGETGTDTGLCSPSDGLLVAWANGVEAVHITNTGLAQIRGVDYAWPAAQGANFSALTNDGSGGLGWVDPLVRTETLVQTSSAGFVDAYLMRNNINPAGSITGTTNQLLRLEQNVGTDDSGFSVEDLATASINTNSANKSSWRNVTQLSLSAQFGNGVDAQTGNNYFAVEVNPQFAASVAVAGNVDIFQVGIGLDAAASIAGGYNVFRSNCNILGPIGSYTGIQLGESLAVVTGRIAPLSITVNATSANDYHVCDVGGIIGTLASDFELIHTAINFTTIQGAQVISDTNTVTTVSAGFAYNEINLSPNIGTTDQYSALRIGPTLGTVNAGVTAIEDFTQITVAGGGYQSLSIHPTLAGLTGDFCGAIITPTVTTSGNAWGIKVDMSGVTAATKIGLDVNGISQFTGRVGGTANLGFNSPTFTPVNGGGNPSSVHLVISGIGVPASSTTANADTIGLNTSSLIFLDTNSTTTSGAFGIGLCSLALPCVVTTRSGASLDQLTAVAGAVVFDASNNGGTIDNVDIFKALSLPEGGTQTITNLRGFLFDLPFGDPGTKTWGVYVKPATADNWMAASLKIGGTAGSTDRVANLSVGLEVEARAVYPTPMTTTARNALTPLEGMLINNLTTNELQRYNGSSWDPIATGGLSGSGTAGQVTYWTGATSLAGENSLAVVRGGTNSGTALNNNRVMQSSGGAIVEAAAITAARVLVSDGAGIPTHSTVTTTTLAFLDATSSIQTQLNGKQATLTTGNLTDVGTDGISITNGTGSVIGTGTTIAQHVADATHNGYLAQADWSTFSSKQAGSSELTAVAALATVGLVARTGSATYTPRTIVAASSKIQITNGDGAAGNPTVDVNQANLSLGSIGGTVSLTTQVSGALPIANGGTAATTKAGGFDALSPMSAAGDLIVGGASGTGTRLAVGANGTLLSPVSGTPTWTNALSALTVSTDLLQLLGLDATSQATLLLKSGNGTTCAGKNWVDFQCSQTTAQRWRIGNIGDDNFSLSDTTASANMITVAKGATNGVALTGCTDGSSAAAGGVGEVKNGTLTTQTQFTTTSGQWFAFASVALTPGDWMISAQVQIDQNGVLTGAGIFIDSSNSTSGPANFGDSAMFIGGVVGGETSGAIVSYHVTTSGTPTYWVKAFAQWAGGAPSAPFARGRITATRIR